MIRLITLLSLLLLCLSNCLSQELPINFRGEKVFKKIDTIDGNVYYEYCTYDSLLFYKSKIKTGPFAIFSPKKNEILFNTSESDLFSYNVSDTGICIYEYVYIDSLIVYKINSITNNLLYSSYPLELRKVNKDSLLHYSLLANDVINNYDKNQFKSFINNYWEIKQILLFALANDNNCYSFFLNFEKKLKEFNLIQDFGGDLTSDYLMVFEKILRSRNIRNNKYLYPDSR